MTRYQHLNRSLLNNGIYGHIPSVKRLCIALGCIEISSHVIRYENNAFHLFRRGESSAVQSVDSLLDELNARKVVMNEDEFEKWMNEEI